MALLLTIAIQLMFMDWTPIDPENTVFPDQDFARGILASIGQSLAGFSGVMVFCYVGFCRGITGCLLCGVIQMMLGVV